VKSFRGILGLFLAVAAVYVLSQVLPPYFHNYQFQDSIDETARFSGVDGRATEEDIRQKVFKSAQDYDVPLTAEQIKVTKNGSEVTISAEYSVHVDLPLRPLDLDFHPSTKQKPIM
jgi:Domain of unknown function (DUF4845)